MLPCLPDAKARCSWHACGAWITSERGDRAPRSGLNGRESGKHEIGMVETTKNPGEKTLSVAPTKTLTLKPRGVEQGVVRQSFSHGRSKAVVVEKVKRRLGPGEAKAEPTSVPERGAPPKRAAAAPSVTAKAPAGTAASASPKSSGVVLRTLTEEERSARAQALAGAQARELAESGRAEQEALARRSREDTERAERAASETRKREEEKRREHDEAIKQKAGQVAMKRF